MSELCFEAKYVQHPRVRHTCQACLKFIKGKHYKVSGYYNSEFYNYHMHEKCFLEMLAICGRCPKQHICTDDNNLTECYKKYKNKKKKNGGSK